MKQPVISMSKDHWIRFCLSLKYGDELAVFCDDTSGEIIEFGSSDNKSPDPLKFVDYLHPVHTFRYLGLGRGATVEADPKGSQYHLIDEYRDRVMKGDTRIIVNRHMDLSIAEFEAIKSEADRQVGKPYGWGGILGVGLYRLVRDTFIGGLVRSWKWNTPFCDRNSPFCSQGVRLQENNVKRFFDVLDKISTWQNNTPQQRFDETTKLTLRVLDTFRIAKDGFFDYPIAL